jgi:divalent metal cation (Fe/Co/Zn/Cd) transporter
MGGLFALYEGIEKVRHPHEVSYLPVAIGILLIAIALETVSLRTAIKEAGHSKGTGTVSWWTWLRNSKQPELPVVLLEDIGAEIGLFFALTGVLLAHYTDEPRWDAAGSLAIGILLVVIAIVLAIEMKGLLIGEGASPADVEAIEGAITAAPSVTRLIHLRTEHLGPDQLLVAGKVEYSSELTVDGLAEAIDETERAIRAVVPTARLVYIEPDVFHAAPAT